MTTSRSRLTLRPGREVLVADSGQGEQAIVLVHGAMCDHRFMHPQWEHLRSRHRTVAIDLVGHGGSSSDPGRHGNDEYADDLARLCELLELSRPVVIGHSTGGNAALSLASRHPDVPGAIVLLEAGPLRWSQGDQRPLRALASRLRTTDGEAALREVVASMFGPTDRFPEQDALLEHLGRASPLVFADIVESDIEWDGREHASSCRVPTLLVVADEPSMDVAEFAELLPTALIGRTIGSGHFHHLVVPDQVNAMIDRFLELLPTLSRT